MLIGFCIFKYFPHGGIQRDLLKLAGECLRRGHRVRVYTLQWNGEVPKGMDVRVLPVSSLNNHRRYLRFHQRIQQNLTVEPVDLLVGLNKMPDLDVYYAGDTCFAEKLEQHRPAWYRLLPRSRLLARFEAAVYAAGLSTKILSISDAEQTVFQQHYQTPDDRFFLLPPGIEKDRIAPPDRDDIRSAFRTEFGLKEEDLLLLFIGSGFRKKGLDRVLPAIAALPIPLRGRARLFVLGSDNARPFQRLARRLGIADQVRFFPGRDDVPRFLFAADGLLLPAYDETAGMIILESMFAGLPALVTENCGYAHYLADTDAGLICREPFVQQDFNQQLVELLTSPERERWSDNGRRAAKQQDFFRLAEVAVDCFEACAAGRAA